MDRPSGAMDSIALLRRTGIFASLDDAALQHLAERCVPRAFRPGYLLFREGDPCAGLYLIRSGRVRVFRATPDGRESSLQVMSITRRSFSSGSSIPSSAAVCAARRCRRM